MSWKDKNGKNLEADDVVILEGRISGRHSSDRISVMVVEPTGAQSGQSVLVDAAICRKGRAKLEPEPEAEPEPETEAQTEAIGDEDAPL